MLTLIKSVLKSLELYLSLKNKKGTEIMQAAAIPAYKNILKKNDLKNIIY